MTFPHRIRRPANLRSLGFSLTELLVVIGIIVVLVGILLVALRGVQTKAQRTRTETTMQQFRQACEAFHQEHGFYPGIVPERFLNADPKLSGMESALLHLMGGAVPETDPQYASFDVGTNGVGITFTDGSDTFSIKVNPDAIGDGPIINGKPYAPYLTPGPNEFGRSNGQWEPAGGDIIPELPELLDAWGNPIVYVRQVRTAGPLASEDPVTDRPQFLLGGMWPYLNSTALGETSEPQSSSVLSPTNSSLNAMQIADNFSQITRHPALSDNATPRIGQARGAFVLFSAGPDGVFFSKIDGPGNGSSPVDVIPDADIVSEYDDIRVFGGG